MFSFFGGSKPAKDAGPSPATAPAPTSLPESPTPTSTALQASAVPRDIPLDARPALLSQRSLKQLGLFFAGAGFFAVSTLITRRAIARKQIAAFPKFYQASHRPSAPKVENTGGSSMALEALNLATINTLSFFMMLTGGTMWAFDISSIDDLRKMAGRHIGPTGGRTDEEAEQEIEEWASTVLKGKETRERGTTTQSRRNE